MTAVCLSCCAALAQDASLPAPSLAQAVDAAWRHRQSSLASQDRVRQAQASGIAARSWLAGAPALEVSTRSDRFHANGGAVEHEAGVALPIWLPGQRDAQLAAADAELAWAEAAEAADRLKLAGEVRERAWEAAAAQAQLAQAEAQARSLKSLADDVARRLAAGELARSDLLDARAEALSADAQVEETRARLAALRAQWRSLTGLEALPDPTEAERGTVAVDEDAHPALRIAELAAQRSERALELVRRSSREAPELGIGLRQERSERGAALERTVAVSLRWSFGTDARNEPLKAEAMGQRNAARVEATLLRQQLAGDRAAAAAALRAAQAQLAAARERQALLAERLGLVDAAFRAGEQDLPALLRARSAQAQAAAALNQQQAALGLARARLHQALGLLP